MGGTEKEALELTARLGKHIARTHFFMARKWYGGEQYHMANSRQCVKVQDIQNIEEQREGVS